MPILLVNAETGSHDTRAAIANTATTDHDTRAAIGNLGVVSLIDTHAALSNSGSVAHDTKAVARTQITEAFDTKVVVRNLLAELFDTKAAIGNLNVVSLIDTRTIVNPPTSFLHAGGNVYFPRAPRRPYRKGLQLNQVREYASGEEVYVYSKGDAGKVTHHLIFAHLDDGDLASLLAFVESTVKGMRKAFTWKDTEQVSRTVRLAGPKVDPRKTGVNHHTVEIVLEEEL